MNSKFKVDFLGEASDFVESLDEKQERKFIITQGRRN